MRGDLLAAMGERNRLPRAEKRGILDEEEGKRLFASPWGERPTVIPTVKADYRGFTDFRGRGEERKSLERELALSANFALLVKIEMTRPVKCTSKKKRERNHPSMADQKTPPYPRRRD